MKPCKKYTVTPNRIYSSISNYNTNTLQLVARLIVGTLLVLNSACTKEAPKPQMPICEVKLYAPENCLNGQWSDECQEQYEDACMDIADEYELEIK